MDKISHQSVLDLINRHMQFFKLVKLNLSWANRDSGRYRAGLEYFPGDQAFIKPRCLTVAKMGTGSVVPARSLVKEDLHGSDLGLKEGQGTGGKTLP